MPQFFFSTILCFVALVYNSFFFSEQPLYANYLTLDSHINTVISHAVAYWSRWRRKPLQGLQYFVSRHKVLLQMRVSMGLTLSSQTA